MSAYQLDISKLVQIGSIQPKDNLIKVKVIKINESNLILIDDSQYRNEILFNVPWSPFDIITDGQYYIKDFRVYKKSNPIHPYQLEANEDTEFIHCQEPFNATPHYRFTSIYTLYTHFINFHSNKILYIDVIGYIESIEPIKSVNTICGHVDMLSFTITDSSNTSISVVTFRYNIESVSSLQQGDIISIKHARISHNYQSLSLSQFSYFELNPKHLKEYKELWEFIKQKQQQSNLLISKSLFSGKLIHIFKKILPESDDEQTYQSMKDNLYILYDVTVEIIDSPKSNRYGCQKCYYLFKDDSLCSRCSLPSNILYDLNFVIANEVYKKKVIVRDSVADKIMWPIPAFQFYQHISHYFHKEYKSVGFKIVDINDEFSIDVDIDSSQEVRSRYAWELVYFE